MPTATHKTTGGSATPGTSAVTGSITCDAGKLITVGVVVDTGFGGGAAATPTLSGLGATWDAVLLRVGGASNRTALRVFRTVLGSEQTGTLTIGVTGSHASFEWTVIQWEDAATGSNGADGILQPTSANDGGVAAATFTVNLSALSDASNVTFGVLSKVGTANTTAGTGFAELGEHSSEVTIQSQWSSTGATACAWSWSGNQRHLGAAMEIVAASTPATPADVELAATYTSIASKTAGATATATVSADVGDVLVMAAAADNVGGGSGGTATLGKTDDGTGTTATSNARKTVSQFTPSSAGTVQSLTMRVYLDAAGSAGVRGVIFADAAGAPGALLAVTDDGTVNWTTETSYTLNFTGANLITLTSGTPYWIGIHHDDPGTPNVVVSRGTTTGAVASNQDTFGDGTATPFGTVFAQAGPNDVYVTYGEAGGGEALPTGAVTDTGSNTWTRAGYKGSSAGALTDVETALYVCSVTTALSNGTVTLTPHASAVAKAFFVWRFRGLTATVRGTPDTAGGSGINPAVTTADPQDTDVVLGIVATEGPVGDTVAGDADTTNGTWSAVTKHGTSGGDAISNVLIAGQWKQVTATGSQSLSMVIPGGDWQALAVTLLAGEASSAPAEYDYVRIQGLEPPGDDYTIEVAMRVVSVTGAQQQRVVWRGQTAGGYYAVEVQPDADTVSVYRYDPSGRSEQHSAALAMSAATVVHIKVQAVGSDHKVRYWLDAASEPGTWQSEFSDATYADGFVGLGGAAEGAQSFDFDDFTLTVI